FLAVIAEQDTVLGGAGVRCLLRVAKADVEDVSLHVVVKPGHPVTRFHDESQRTMRDGSASGLSDRSGRARQRHADSPRLPRTCQPSRRDKGGQPRISILGTGNQPFLTTPATNASNRATLVCPGTARVRSARFCSAHPTLRRNTPQAGHLPKTEAGGWPFPLCLADSGLKDRHSVSSSLRPACNGLRASCPSPFRVGFRSAAPGSICSIRPKRLTVRIRSGHDGMALARPAEASDTPESPSADRPRLRAVRSRPAQGVMSFG